MKKFFVRFLPDWLVTNCYMKAGGIFGEALSCVGVAGPCVGFEKFFARWEFWEAEYARRGYRTVNIEEFYKLGFGSVDSEEFITMHLRWERKPGEELVLHAAPAKAWLIQEDWFRRPKKR